MSSLVKWRHFVCVPVIVILPVSLLADDTAAAILRSNTPGVSVNKNAVPTSIAIFHDDLIETSKSAAARIEIAGSTADVDSETVVQFEGDELVLDHGRLSVNTSRGLRVRVGCITVTPVNTSEWTHYEVVDVDGKVTVSALKNDAYIDARANNQEEGKESKRNQRATVRESEQKSREEKCAGTIREVTAKGPLLNSPWAKLTGGVAVAVVTCWALCRSDDPLSPSTPAAKP